MPRSDQRISCHNSSHTRIQLQAAAARGWTAAGRQDRSVVFCANRGKYTCTLYESSKAGFASKNLHAYVGIKDAEAQSPRGCCGNPGICLRCAQGQKRLKGLPRATHCTDRAQTSSNVSPTVELCPPHPTFGTKVRTRRDTPEGEKQITIVHIHIENEQQSKYPNVYQNSTVGLILLRAA